MDTYEFWNEMDKIFDAIVAYQEKNIEFNKQFINPWIKLSNTFDKQDSNETIVAYKNAIEIDPHNAQNWYQLAGIYMRAGNYDKSIQAYQKANELGLESGDLYKNLALAHVMAGRYQASIPIFEKGLDCLENDEEKVDIWNHLGNVYRKLNNYEKALQAFQMADRIENPVLEDLPDVEIDEDVLEVQAEETPLVDDQADVSQPTEETVPVVDDIPELEDDVLDEPDEEIQDDPMPEVEQALVPEMEADDDATSAISDDEDEPFEDDEQLDEQEIDYGFDHSNLPTLVDFDFSKTSPVEPLDEDLFDELSDDPYDDESPANHLADSSISVNETEPQDVAPESSIPPAAGQQSAVLDTDSFLDEDDDEPFAQIMRGIPGLVTAGTEYSNDVREELTVSDDDGEEGFPAVQNPGEEAPSVHLAYEEYLNDTNSLVGAGLIGTDPQNVETIAGAFTDMKMTGSKAGMNISPESVEETDTKNAYVWNELGNVYFNAGSFDDAISAYRKAVNLDGKFAWPYTNLALSYVQMGRLEDAISLYQRSIELFSTDKDKAVTWNRLGNVYRRLNDYENAIAAYQRADELDPGNAAITQQSKFSLLGSEKVGQEVGYTL